tara:strand:+ start:23 stop:286 length:264 start_codon:yes stop_codon:yes gene_type:complete
MKKLIYLSALLSMFALASCGGGEIEKKQKTFSFDKTFSYDDGPSCQKECCSGSERTEEVPTEEVPTEEAPTEEVATKQCCSATKDNE